MKRAHLQLVPTHPPTDVEKTSEANSRPSPVMARSGHQLDLPFDDDFAHQRIIVVVMDQIHGSELCRLICEIKPKTAVDLRNLIRFDLPGTNRSEVFHCLSSNQTLYVKAPISWHNLESRDFMAGDKPLSQRLNHEVVERGDGPVMLFASKQDDAKHIMSHLNRTLSSRAKNSWKIEKAV